MIPWATIARVAGKVLVPAGKWLIYEGLGVVERAVARREQKRKGLSFKDVAHIKAQSEAGAEAARRSAKTVIIKRREP